MVSFPNYLLSEDLHRPAVEQSACTSNKAAIEFRWQRLLGCAVVVQQVQWVWQEDRRQGFKVLGSLPFF